LYSLSSSISAELFTLYPALNNTGPKGHQRQLCQLEMLHPKGNPNDGNTKQTAPGQMMQSQRNPGYQNPDNVHYQGHRPAAILNFLPKREKGHGSELKTLYPYRRAYDGYTPQTPGQKPAKAAYKAAKYKP
jgi:hypothetical protein